jgi:hypothetical protein
VYVIYAPPTISTQNNTVMKGEKKREKGENSQGERTVKTVRNHLTCGECITCTIRDERQNARRERWEMRIERRGRREKRREERRENSEDRRGKSKETRAKRDKR